MSAPAQRLVLIVAGGTGGHLYPGIAVARALRKQSPLWEVVFAVRRGDLGKALLEREGFKSVELPGTGWPRRLSIKMLTVPFLVSAGFLRAWSAISELKPGAVIGMGGYLSFPVLTAAHLRGVPTLIHEQNVRPGLANRLLSRWVKSVAVSFSESQAVFMSKKVWVSGLPVREEIGRVATAEARRRLQLSEKKLTFLIFGGSQGAQRLNAAAVGTWPILSERAKDFQVLHITGEKHYGSMRDRYAGLPVQATVIPYCHEMAAALSAADLVISRAGASTIAELLIAGKPAILVPFPFASENHQFYNAEVLVKRGAAELIPDAELTPEILAERLRIYLGESGRLAAMRERIRSGSEDHQRAAQKLADYVADFS